MPRFVGLTEFSRHAHRLNIGAFCPSFSPTSPRLVQSVGSPVIWRQVQGSDKGCLPVQRRVARRSLQVVRNFSRSNDSPGTRCRRGPTWSAWTSGPESPLGRAESTIATYTAGPCHGQQRVWPYGQPPGRTVQCPPSAGASMYVQFAKQGPRLSWQNTSPLPIVPGESTNFIVAGMLPNTTYLMRHVLDDGTVSAPSGVLHRELPANLLFPNLQSFDRRPLEPT